MKEDLVLIEDLSIIFNKDLVLIEDFSIIFNKVI